MKPLSFARTDRKTNWRACAMLAALPLSGLFWVAHPSGAFAQEVDSETHDARCWLASKSYSTGIVIMGGGGALVCSSAGAWEPTESAATGCVFGSDFYSAGASMQRLNNAPINECTAQGIWSIPKADE